MTSTVIRGMVCVGGAALAAGSLALQPAEAQGIEGPYAGLSLGLATGQPDASPYYSFSGAVAGAFVGYNALMGDSMGGSLVVGPELVWHNRANITAGGGMLVPFDLFYGDMSFRNIVDLRLRVGQTFGDSLVYGAIGWSRATASGGGKMGKFPVVLATKGPIRPRSSTVSGLNLGLGFETGLGNGMFVGGDVTYRRLGNSFNGKMGGSGNLTTATLRVGLRF